MNCINRKGQALEQISIIGIGILTLTVVLAIVFVLMSSVNDNSISQVDSISVVNETVTWTYDTWVPLANSPNAMEVTCTSVVEV